MPTLLCDRILPSDNSSEMAFKSKKTSNKWSEDEDNVLRNSVYKYGGKKWKIIASCLEDRSPEECNLRWSELQSSGWIKKTPWSKSEDSIMLEKVEKYGAKKWAVIASFLHGRNGKQCRERWHNQLNPEIKKGPWTIEEDMIILKMQAQHGNRWAMITEKLPGRTDNAVKNHWYSSIKSRINSSNTLDPERHQIHKTRGKKKKRNGRREKVKLSNRYNTRRSSKPEESKFFKQNTCDKLARNTEIGVQGKPHIPCEMPSLKDKNEGKHISEVKNEPQVRCDFSVFNSVGCDECDILRSIGAGDSMDERCSSKVNLSSIFEEIDEKCFSIEDETNLWGSNDEIFSNSSLCYAFRNDSNTTYIPKERIVRSYKGSYEDSLILKCLSPGMYEEL